MQCQRAGGGFGGKLTGGLFVSSAAALCAKKLHRPVRIFNSRAWDMTMQGTLTIKLFSLWKENNPHPFYRQVEEKNGLQNMKLDSMQMVVSRL